MATIEVRIGTSVPRRGNAFARGIGRLLLWAMGWRVRGEIPDLPKMLLIAAPHTSNMDGVLALATLTALGLRSGTMIKSTAFRGPLGPLLRWFGAIPIDRRSPKGVVEQSVDAFRRSPSLLLLLTPEGTRTAAPEWKRGFYHIARGAEVPILLGAVDYQHRVILFGPLLWPSGDYEADLRQLLAFYGQNSWPRHLGRLSLPLRQLGEARWNKR